MQGASIDDKAGVGQYRACRTRGGCAVAPPLTVAASADDWWLIDPRTRRHRCYAAVSFGMRKVNEHARQYNDPHHRGDGGRRSVDRPDYEFRQTGRSARFPRHLDWRLDGPRPPDFGFAPGIDRPCRGDVKDRARDQRPATAIAQSGRAGSPGAIAASDVEQPADPRRRKRLDTRRFRAAWLRLRSPFSYLQERPRNHEQGVERRTGQWRDAGDVARMQGWSADPDRRLAQPALDPLRRQAGAGMDPVRPLQQPRRP